MIKKWKNRNHIFLNAKFGDWNFLTKLRKIEIHICVEEKAKNYNQVILMK